MKKLIPFLLLLPLALLQGDLAKTQGVAISGLAKLQGTAPAAGGYDPDTDTSVVQWMKADTLSQSDDTEVTTWTAETGNDGTTPGSNPTFQTNEQNSLPTITDPGSTYFDVATFGTLTQPFRVWIMCKFGDTGGYRFAFDGIDGTGRGAFLITGSAWEIYAGSDATTGAVNTSYHIFELIFNGASSSITIDDGSPATVSPGANSLIGMTLFSSNDQVTGGTDVHIGEIIVQDDLSETAADVRSYLNTRWAIY